MKYTLYIDESGDFESQKGQWVLSGVLLPDLFDVCENRLSNNFKLMPRNLDLQSIKSFHLTKFRADYLPATALDMAQKTLNKLNDTGLKYNLLAVVNYSKISMQAKEKTYRLMLLDLLALCETVIPDDDVIDHLDLIIATRTIDGVLQTSASDIKSEVVNSLPAALEVDLATRGMVDLVGRHISVKLLQANKSWGLVCADFIANLTYHNRRKAEKEYLENLMQQEKYALFESFGGYEFRRAIIAERSGDFVLSLYRWLLLSAKSNDTEKHIDRLLLKMLNQQGTTSQKTSFETLLERLWRNHDSSEHSKLSSILSILENQLSSILNSAFGDRFSSIIFRVRNMILLVENHLGNVARSQEVVYDQEKMVISLGTNPENFPIILDFKINAIEVSVNSLDFDDAMKKSLTYQALVNDYREVWKLLVNDEQVDGFNKSRVNIKSEMTVLRCQILLTNSVLDDLKFDAILEKFSSIKELLERDYDFSRLRNLKIMFLLRQHKIEEVVSYCNGEYLEIILSDTLSPFDLLWVLHAVNDAFLYGLSAKSIDLLVKGARLQINKIDINKTGHPMDLIWREISLFEFLQGNQSNARKAIKKSKNSFSLEKSPISKWLQELIEVHANYINEKTCSEADFFHDGIPIKINSNREMSFLQKVRYHSPY